MLGMDEVVWDTKLHELESEINKYILVVEIDLLNEKYSVQP